MVDGKCSVHEFKPLQCKTYPFWPEVLHSPRSWKAEQKYCEGISEDGDHYDLLGIARILNGDATS
ncbi:MAG: Fe-S-cluster containining protein [Bradymonadia bacterium]